MSGEGKLRFKMVFLYSVVVLLALLAWVVVDRLFWKRQRASTAMMMRLSTTTSASATASATTTPLVHSSGVDPPIMMCR